MKREKIRADSSAEVELDKVYFKGHRNILGLHKNTIEVTKDTNISKRADCIIGVGSSKGCADLNEELKSWIRSGKALKIEIEVGTDSFALTGKGSPELDLTDEHEIVLRRSDYVSSRTAALHCSHAAIDMPRELILKLQNPLSIGILIFSSSISEPEQDTFTIL